MNIISNKKFDDEKRKMRNGLSEKELSLLRTIECRVRNDDVTDVNRKKEDIQQHRKKTMQEKRT